MCISHAEEFNSGLTSSKGRCIWMCILHGYTQKERVNLVVLCVLREYRKSMLFSVSCTVSAHAEYTVEHSAI